MVKRVELGRSRPSGETPAQRDPRSNRRARRLPVPALGAVTALMVAAVGWPGIASAGIHSTGPVGPGPAPSARPWLLSRTAPALLPPPAAPAAPAVSTDVYVAPLKHVLPVDVVAVSPTTLPAAAVNKVRGLPGVRAVQAVDAARVRVNGRFAAVLGVNPSGFRRFAAKPTAKDTAFWRSVEGGGLGLSYEMGKQDKLPTGTPVTVAGRSMQTMRVGKFGTVGIGGVDAVISDRAARALGFPVHNAIVISAPAAHFTKLTREIKKALPHGTEVDQLVVQTGAGDLERGRLGGGRLGAADHRRAGLRDRDPRLPGSGGEPARHALCVGRGRAHVVRLLRARAMVVRARPAWSCHGWPRTRPAPAPRCL